MYRGNVEYTLHIVAIQNAMQVNLISFYQKFRVMYYHVHHRYLWPDLRDTAPRSTVLIGVANGPPVSDKRSSIGNTGDQSCPSDLNGRQEKVLWHRSPTVLCVFIIALIAFWVRFPLRHFLSKH